VKNIHVLFYSIPHRSQYSSFLENGKREREKGRGKGFLAKCVKNPAYFLNERPAD
jgi:hypothetical protein